MALLPLAFNSELFTQLLVNGLTLGSVYALIALGYSMVYGILKLLELRPRRRLHDRRVRRATAC